VLPSTATCSAQPDIHACTHTQYTCAHVHMCTRTHVHTICTRTHVHTDTIATINIHTYTRRHTDTLVHTYTHSDTHIHTYTHTDTHIHTYTHSETHIHTYTHSVTHIHTHSAPVVVGGASSSRQREAGQTKKESGRENIGREGGEPNNTIQCECVRDRERARE